MTKDLCQAAAELIGRLPADAARWRRADVRALLELHTEIATVMKAGDRTHRELAALAKARGRGDDTPFLNYLTRDELSALLGSQREALDAQRACHALYEFADRCGYHALIERVTGEKPPEIPHDAIVTEDLDGELRHLNALDRLPRRPPGASNGREPPAER